MGEAGPFLAWFLPHVAGLLMLLKARRPTRKAVGAGAVYGLLLLAPVLVVLLLDLVGVLPSTGRRRWEMAAEFIWIGFVAPFWQPRRGTLTKAAAVLIAVAGVWTAAIGVSWLRPNWELVNNSWVIDRHGEFMKVGTWEMLVRRVGVPGGSETLSVHSRDGAVGSQAGGLLSTRDSVEVLGNGFVRFADKPYFLLSGRWADGLPIEGRRFRVTGGFVSLESVRMEGCRGWRFTWQVGPELAANCAPQEWVAGEVEVRSEVDLEAASGDSFEVAWFDMGGLTQRWTGLQVEEFKEGAWADVTEGLKADLTPGLHQIVVENDSGRNLLQTTLPITVSPSDSWEIDASGGMIVNAGSPPRVRAWTLHPNQLASLLVVALSTLAAFGVRPRKVMPLLFLGVILLVTTGSRSGLAAGLAIALVTSIRLVPGRWKWWTAGALSAIGALAIRSIPRLTTLIDLSGPAENVLSRWEIVVIAWRGLWINPLSGMGDGISALAESIGVPSYAVPTHAHNVWLEIGTLFGVPAMLCAIALTFIGVAWALRTNRFSRCILILPAVFLSLTDITTLRAMAALPLALALLAARTAGRGKPAASESEPTPVG